MARTSRKKKKHILRLIILAIVFVLALGVYFTWTFLNTEKEYTVYTSMEEPTLPVVYTSVYGTELNCMHGYLQDMGNQAAGDYITVLPQNRRLELRIAAYGNMVAGVSYEVRSLDLDHFIERTTVEDFQQDNGNLSVTLPIQNLIEKDTQYLLSIQLDTGERTIHYYTRIIWTDSDTARQMISFASDFARKTFDYEEARSLTTYLETNEAADNTDLSHVTIRSNFSQLTWGSTGMQLATDLDVTLREFDGIMGAVELHYMATRQNELGNTERYQVVEHYTLRAGSERIYLMDFDRRTNQLFEGNKHLFSGKRILLGIADREALGAESSANGQYIAYLADQELWSYDQNRKHAVNVFSFRSGVDDGARANYDQHGIRILSVENNGNIDFVVYGYMNRGRHEGYNGIVYYQYNRANDTITERFFIPVAQTYEHIRLELQELCRKGSNDMLYLKQNGAIVAIDLRSLEMLDIAAGLTDGSYAVSEDQSMAAWQEGPLYRSDKIKLMDLRTGNTQTISADAGEYLRVLGFMNRDLVYGRAKAGDDWILSGLTKGLPMYRLEIVSSQLTLLKEYEAPGQSVNEVRVSGNRIHLALVQKNGTADQNHAYLDSGEDTIIYQNETDTDTGLIGSYDSTDRKRVYYVALEQEIKTTRNLRVSVPKRISYENAGTIDLGKPRTETAMGFYYYASGQFQGRTWDFSKAVEACYDGFGWVTDTDGRILYNRTDRESLRHNTYPSEGLKSFTEHLQDFTENQRYPDGWILLNGQGLTLSQALYYVYQGWPVALYLEDMQYLILSGYDNFNVEFYDPQTEETRLMGKEDAEAFVTTHQNDLICSVLTEAERGSN